MLKTTLFHDLFFQMSGFSCQWCIFEPASSPNQGGYSSHQLINLPELTSLGQLVLYMSDNMGTLYLPKVTSYV